MIGRRRRRGKRTGPAPRTTRVGVRSVMLETPDCNPRSRNPLVTWRMSSIASVLDKLATHRTATRPLQPPASPAAIDALARVVHDRFGVDLSSELRALYAIADGFDHDGLQVFATERAPFASKPSRSINGLIEMN